METIATGLWAIKDEAFAAAAAMVTALNDQDAIIAGASAGGSPNAAAGVSFRAGANGQRVAVIDVAGVIVPRAPAWFTGAASMERIGVQFREAMASDAAAVILAIDSPGGVVSGVAELANEIYAARGSKPIVAVASHMAASAAYWLAAAADEIVVSPSGEVGSIGVFAAHLDQSQYLENLGLKVTLVTAGKHKAEFSSYAPLSEDARAHLQEDIDYYYGLFTAAVARGRGVEVNEVVNGMGQGRVLNAKAATKAGMVDRVATLEETIRRFQGRGRVRGARADLDYRQRRARLLAISGSVES